MRPATGRKTSRLNGTTSAKACDPSHRNAGGTPVEVTTDCSCQTFARPRMTKLMPSVMISGWTRKTPTPMPVTNPASAAATSATTIPVGVPAPAANDATTKPDIEATAPTERSMPPVSIVSVWHPARIARSTAARRMTLTHSGLTMPGRTRSLMTTRTARRPSSGIIGRSLKRPRQAAAVSQGLGAPEALARPHMRATPGSEPGCRSSPPR